LSVFQRRRLLDDDEEVEEKVVVVPAANASPLSLLSVKAQSCLSLSLSSALTRVNAQKKKKQQQKLTKKIIAFSARVQKGR